MPDIIQTLRRAYASRHLRFRSDAIHDVVLFLAIGRNGNWPIEINFDPRASILYMDSMLPLTVNRLRWHAIADLTARINRGEDENSFAPSDETGRVHCRTVHHLLQDMDEHEVIALVESHIAAVDRHLPSFFAVVAGRQTPGEAVDQMERLRLYG